MHRNVISLSVLLSTLATGQADETITRCFEGSEIEPNGNVTFGCPKGSVISITDATIGRNAWMECLLTEDDCVQSTKIFDGCEGLTICSRHFKTYSPRCGYITILLLSYTCLQTALAPPTPHVTLPADVSSNNQQTISSQGSPSSADQSEGREYRPPKSQSVTAASVNSEEEIGLIVATVFASLLTAFMLVVAIIMTIRRLLDYPTRNRRANCGSSNRLAICLESACVHVDKFPCFRGPGDISGQESLPSQKGDTPLSREDALQRSRRRRMAPIGQESSDDNTEPNNVDHEHEQNDTDTAAVIRANYLTTGGPGPTYHDQENENGHSDQRSTGVHQGNFRENIGNSSSTSFANDCLQSQDKLRKWDAKIIHRQLLYHDAKQSNNNINNMNNMEYGCASQLLKVKDNHVVSLPTNTAMSNKVEMNTLPVNSGLPHTRSDKNSGTIPLSVPGIHTHGRPGSSTHTEQKCKCVDQKSVDVPYYYDTVVLPHTETCSKC